MPHGSGQPARPPAPTPRPTGVPSLAADRSFRLLLAGQTTSQLGTQVSAVALPLLAVVTLGATSFEVGLINAASTLAFALVGLPAGAWLDRRRRQPVLVVSDAVRAVLLATVPLAAVTGRLTVTHLVVVSFLVGLARVFFDVGYRSFLPAVIGADRVLAGNSAMEMVRAGGQVAGPGLGGALVSLVGAAAVVGVQAVTFVVSAVCLGAIRATEPGAGRGADRPGLRAEIAEGLRFVIRHRVLRATALASALSNVSFAVASAVTMIFLTRTLGLTPALVGVVLAAGSVTVLLGAGLTPRLSRRLGSARIIWVSLAITAPISLLGALARPGWWALLVVVGIAAGELGQIVYSVTNVSLRQRVCPDRLLGRVNATTQVLILGLFPLGALAGGVLGDTVGPRWTLVVAGVLLLGAPVVMARALRGARDVEELDHARAGDA